MEQTKKCPFCAEEINIEAIKCKHCGSDLLNKKKISGETLFFIFIFGFVFIGLGIYTYLSNTYYFEANDCKKLVAEKMKDPDSLEFISYEGNRDDIELIIKGEYKSKNSYGAYDRGYFFCDKVSNEDMVTRLDEKPINSLNDAVNNNIDKYNQVLKQFEELYK